MRFIFAVLIAANLILSAAAVSNESLETDTFAEGLKLSQADRTIEAIATLKKVVYDRRAVLADYAQFKIGDLYFYKLKNRLEAAAAYRQVRENYDRSLLVPQAYLMEGKSYFAQKNYRQAIRVWRELLAGYPDAAETSVARFQIALSFAALKDWQAAYQAYAETDLNDPLSSWGRQARVAMRRLEKSRKKQISRIKYSPQALYKKGSIYFQEGEYDLAANVFGVLTREFPKSKQASDAWLMLGRAEMQTSRYPFALSNLQRATKGEPSQAARAYYYLGLTYGQRGDYDTAIYNLRKAADEYPRSDTAPDALYWSAYYLELKERLNDALLEYHKVLDKYPKSQTVSAAIWRMGRIYFWNGDPNNAAAYWRLAEQYPPGEESARCYFFWAKALEKLEKSEEAERVYRELIARFDHNYYSYRAREMTGEKPTEKIAFSGNDFCEALDGLGENDRDQLAALMEIWLETKGLDPGVADPEEIDRHWKKYQSLILLDLVPEAAAEARYLIDLTSGQELDLPRARLGAVLVASGNYRAPISYAERSIKAAVLAGKPETISKDIWRLGYPCGYFSLVNKQADKYKLDPYLTLAVIREESRFNPRAVSRSKAQGLMQIMPATGRGLAKSLKLKPYSTASLSRPDVNIKMGSYFLAYLIKEFKGNVYLALAAYNGGPNRIKRYVKEWHNGRLEDIDVDVFVESIPIRETRLYVQKVMGSYFEYKRLYD